MTDTEASPAAADWQRRLAELRSTAVSELDGAADAATLEQWRVTHLGRKSALSELLGAMGKLTPDERRVVGSEANLVKRDLEQAFSDREGVVRQRELAATLERERIDVTLPGRPPSVGALHPITQTLDECVSVLRGMGFLVTQTPEVETDYYNFESLNIPSWHPARDMQDTFYVRVPDVLLRTQTTAYQARVMSTQEPPVRIVNVGRCYRADQVDATHEWMFHQLDGLAVDEGLRLSDLRGTLTTFAQRMFGSSTRTRFRCDYFPFVEPGVDFAISCYRCDGTESGCPICHGSGWLEILGAGMVHPRVLARVGYDPERVTGFAWGMGIERITLIKYAIEDIRLFYANDLRFLEQFR
ncbi:MAG TPA: phenylalanine--tRNA ligase subunit alpha [Chloroflexota bacterium]|nr:phenylalanine--tRNA ligase subunit alpha [Chloroflexota bacterium]